MDNQKIKQLIESMTIEEKAAMCSGEGSWYTKDIERLDIPAIMVSDGPVGLRKQDKGTDHLGINDSVETICFPSACATSCSFDRELLYEMGKTLGKECQSENVAVLLGPAVNIKRSPLCGRNFEYISEDPYVAGELATEYIDGLQSVGAGTSIKHFAVNNQEHERMNSSSNIDERTLREIYLPAFEKAVKKSKPWTVMCSYNRINGVYASENKWLLTDVLRDEWGYDGCVISDWGAVSDRIEGLKAGLNLEMPGSDGANDELIIQAVKSGELSEEVLNQNVERILQLIFRYSRDVSLNKDLERDHEIAGKIERESIVLLKNERETLPLSKDEKVVIIGEFARTPRYQGGGSAHVNAHRVTSMLSAAKDISTVKFAAGFSIEQDEVDDALEREALELANTADKVVVFAGLPDAFESEGFDRKHMKMPNNQNHLIRQLISLGKSVTVVLHNGAPVEMPWISNVDAVVETYLGGEAVGEAIFDILYGEVNPCGKLAETFPLKIEDTPCFLSYPGLNQQADYYEGIFVGYRYYDKKKMDVLFPFGHGLSYTSFEYSNLKLSKNIMTEKEEVTVSVDIFNSGRIEGKEIVQLYVTDCTEIVNRPEKELKGFEKVHLMPGETKTVEMRLDASAFSWYDCESRKWRVNNGEYLIKIGKSSRNIVDTAKITIYGSEEAIPRIDKDTMIGDLLKCSLTRNYVKTNPLLQSFVKDFTGDKVGENGENQEMIDRMVEYMPLRSLRSFSRMNNEDLNRIVEEIERLI